MAVPTQTGGCDLGLGRLRRRTSRGRVPQRLLANAEALKAEKVFRGEIQLSQTNSPNKKKCPLSFRDFESPSGCPYMNGSEESVYISLYSLLTVAADPSVQKKSKRKKTGSDRKKFWQPSGLGRGRACVAGLRLVTPPHPGSFAGFYFSYSLSLLSFFRDILFRSPCSKLYHSRSLAESSCCCSNCCGDGGGG